MTSVIDRRAEPDRRYHSSRERFMKRNREQIKKAIDRAISNSDIKDIGKGGTDVTVPNDGVREPVIHHGQGGRGKRVLPGNKQFSTGDRIKKPKGGGGGGQGGEPGEPGEGQSNDDFVFNLSEEEFLNYLYEDLELPNLSKKSAQDTKVTHPKRAGFTSNGPQNKLDLQRSYTQKLGRTIATKKQFDKRILESLYGIREILLRHDATHTPEAEALFQSMTANLPISKKVMAVQKSVEELEEKFGHLLTADEHDDIAALQGRIDVQTKKKSIIPKWNESTDLRYRYHKQEPTPTTQAVMFCLMDVSASMDQEKKNNAKLFYTLLHRFLLRNYEKVDIVFIRHTDEAEEVDEQTFFFDAQSGGTKVSTSIALMHDVIKERYPLSEWNVYGAQASDGENFGSDNDECDRLLRELLKDIQAYFYTEVTHPNGYSYGQSLWEAYEPIGKAHPDQFFMGKIKKRSDIWPVFRTFFSKRENYESAPANRSGVSSFSPLSPLTP